jgi:hypothetical protein
MPDAPAQTPPDDGETLRLDDALKLAGIATTGGEAKMLIQSGAVRSTARSRPAASASWSRATSSRSATRASRSRWTRRRRGRGRRGRVGRPRSPADPGAGRRARRSGRRDDDETRQDEDWDDDAELDDADDDADGCGDDDELAWAAEDRVADDDVEAVIIRLGELHPDALEAVFAACRPRSRSACSTRSTRCWSGPRTTRTAPATSRMQA